MESLTQRSFLRRYLMALLAPALVAGVMQLTSPLLDDSLLALYLLAVVFCGWYGGLRPGLLSVCFSMLLVDYFFIPYFSMVVQNHHDAVPLAVLGQRLIKHKQAADALNESRRYLQALFDNSLDAILVTNNEGRYIDANPAACGLLGYTHDELMQLSILDLTAEPFRQEGWAMWQEFLATGSMSGEYSTLRKDGSVIQVEFRAVANILPGLHVSSSRDITERKRAEEAKREADQKYRDIFENALEGVFQTSPEGRFVVANPALARMFGFDSPEDLIRERADISKQHYVDPKRRDEFKRLLEEEGIVHHFEYEEYRKDGSKIWVLYNVRAVRDQNGTLLCYEGTAKDITERRRVEEALRESEERYRELFENAKDATYVHDLSGRYISVNRAAEKLSGHTREEIIGRQFADFVPPEQIEVVNEHLCRKLVEEGETIYETEVIARDGRRIPVEVSSHLIYQNGVGVGVQGTARDITGRKRAEDQLRIAKDFSENLIQTANVIILGLDVDGNINIFNQTAEKITGYTAAELKGRSWFEMLVPKNQYPSVWDEFMRLVDGGMPMTFENPILTKSGEERYIMWQNNQVRVDGRIMGTISFGNDITERKRAEEALRQSEERFSKAFHSSPAALYIALLEDDRLLEVNAAFLRMTGFTGDEVIGRTTVELGLWTSLYRRVLAEALRERWAVANLDIKFQKKSGEIRDGLLSVELIHLDAGPSVLAIAQDVTQRNRAEERLREYEKAVEGLEEMIVVVDRNFRYLLANRAYLKHRGKNRDQVLGHAVTDIVGKAFFEGVVRGQMEQAFQGQVVNYEVNTTYPDPGGRDLMVSYFPIEGTTGIDRIACVLRDITEHKRAEAALRESEERFAKAFQASPAALSIALLDDARLLEVNDAFLRMTGYERDEVIGKSTLELGLWLDSNPRITMAGLLRERGTVTDLEIKFRRKSGEERNGLLSVDLIELSGKACVLGTTQDITERKRAEAALRNYSRLLIEAQEAERQNIARELHDQIGQVLTAIHLNLQAVWETCESSEARALIDEGVAIVDQALTQVRDLSFELRPSLLDDLGLVTALRWYADRFAQRTGIRATTTIDLPESSIRLRQELETACFRILQEALTNVVRHARARNVSITLKRCEDQVRLSIKDDGIGFDVYSQNLAAFTGRVGLRGMKERALALGGRLEIKSSPSRGTEIRSYFPLAGEKD